METWLPRRIFVTGTDTGVGKSLVCAILMAALPFRYWKPIQSGLEEQTDTEWIREVTGCPRERFLREAYRLKAPLSPHASAAIEGIHIELDSFSLPPVSDSESLIVEGAGGIMVPLNERYFMLDLMKRLALPILLVARSTLGTINHTLLSLEQLRRHGLDVYGVVMNGPENTSNRKAIEHYGNVLVYAEIESLPQINPQILAQVFQKCFKYQGETGCVDGRHNQ
jgi:dethiobiotin synthase